MHISFKLLQFVFFLLLFSYVPFFLTFRSIFFLSSVVFLKSNKTKNDEHKNGHLNEIFLKRERPRFLFCSYDGTIACKIYNVYMVNNNLGERGRDVLSEEKKE